MRVDSHHHLWDRSATPQRWIGPALRAIDRDFATEDLVSVAAEYVDRTILVQTVCTPTETPLLLEYAAASPLIGAVVGWADLTNPGLDDVIERLRHSRHGSWLRGIRHQVQGEADPLWLQRPDVLHGLRTVAEHGLIYELLTLPHQLPAAVTVVERLPEVSFVVDHLSKPPLASIDPDEMMAWEANIRALSTFPNVSAKISGLVTEADWHKWTIDDIRPAVEIAIDAFGPARLMAGSDWPVCLLAASYEQVQELNDALLRDLSTAEQQRISGNTAAEVYDVS